jgi:hypothetical protein
MVAGSTDLGVARLDVVWPGIVANDFIDLLPYFPEEIRKQHVRERGAAADDHRREARRRSRP